MKKLLAEFIGTFWLVLGGCGSAVLATGFPDIGIGFMGVSLAFGLTVMTMAYALGHISGGHFNPAVTLGLWAGGRVKFATVLPYAASQVLGGVLGAAVLFLIASDATAGSFDVHAGFASNGYGVLSPGGYGLQATLLAEVVLTAGFVLVIMGVTDARASGVMAPLAIGLCLTLIHLISIPIDSTSVNPARSTAVALFSGGEWLGQLWVFWAAPLVGGCMGGGLYRLCFSGAEQATVSVDKDA
ncbi:aquaporin Z [Rahnella aceris]|uniref:aquaporin Z n=1 Tax=Rahnella sp. (strain Y9602) TaxID=2703885 RepID=UPI001C2665CB|nr:aquaporin Z [Rahnella aceris]MBU9839041.1 aquaporin Z [Rahnella aceris]